MRSSLICSLALSLFASNAFAVGADLSAVACPGSPGATNDVGMIDCAGGASLVLLVTFMPAESIPDLVAADAIIDFWILAGDLTSTADFWNFETVNSAALRVNHDRPGAGCSSYVNTFGGASSGSTVAAALLNPSRCRVALASYRSTNLSVSANQRLFAAQLIIDTGTSVEAGGTASGCTGPTWVSLQSVVPQSASDLSLTPLTSGSVFPQGLSINYGYPPDATRNHTWGQLKSLYR